jgi:AraC-like DNA-binding protein
MRIQVFNDINDSHAATGYTGRTDLPSFHIFTLEDTYPETRTVMPPYTFAFYQVVLLEHSDDAVLNINAEAIAPLSDSVTFASPAHVLAWVRGTAQRGFILYFKDEFLAHYPVPISDEFPYFRLTEINLLRVNGEEKQTLRNHFAQMLTLFHSLHPYRVQMLQALLLVLLFDCKRLYEIQQQTMKQTSPRDALALRFQHFVNQHYLTRKTVQAYADLLAVSPDYLGQTIRATTGKTAHRLIAERILLEAKKLLTYSDLNIAEIAQHLGYDEPTHFGRFFRRYVGTSPRTWRQHQHRP